MAALLSNPAPATVYLVSTDSIVDAATSGMLNSNKVFSGSVVAVPSNCQRCQALGSYSSKRQQQPG